MSDRVWRLGSDYVDKAASRHPDDQFLHWFKTEEDISISNSGGIRWLSYSRQLGIPGNPACIVLVTNHPSYANTYHWIEQPPDYHTGTFFYWGDAVESNHEDALDARGNTMLHRVWSASPSAGVDIPVLIFQKPAQGVMKFLGLAAIFNLKKVEEPQVGGVKASNLLCELALLNATEVSADWLTKRAVAGPSVDAELAPPAWNKYLSGETERLCLSDQQVSDLALPDIPREVGNAIAYVAPTDILEAIARYEGGEQAGFRDSHTYDLVYHGERYPPVAIMGMALKKVIGRDAHPGELEGGQGTKTFRHLKRLGFEIRPKSEAEAVPDETGVLLAWNREKWPWSDLASHIALIRSGSAKGDGTTIGSERWSVGNRKDIPVGTRFFIVKLGQNPKGVFGCGRTSSPIFEDDHFDLARAAAGEKARYVNLEWEDLINPLTEGALDVWSSADPAIAHFHWSSQQSGPTIGPSTLRSLEAAWKAFRHGEEEIPPMPPEQYTLQDATHELFLDPSEIERIRKSLTLNKNAVLQGPPGVGKSFIARRLAYLLLGEKDPGRVEMVQFHQSYSYEDFIQGYRPSTDGFARRDGVFYRFCRKAQRDLDSRPYVFIIDEINRGNLASILGEVMLLIEKDKRGPEHAIPLAYSTEEDEAKDPDNYRFYIPENMHVLGLMNTADRSLAIVDYALRRRFRFFSLWPRFGTAYVDYMKATGCEPDLINKIVNRMQELNGKISEDYHNLGPGFQIGHSFFCPSPEESANEAWYEHTVRESIEPLLDEYFGIEDPDKVKELTSWLLS